MKKLWQLLTRDIGRKLLALAFALILYGNFSEGRFRDRELDVPVTLELAPELALPPHFNLGTVKVTLFGPEKEINKLTSNSVYGKVKVDSISNTDITLVPLHAGDFVCSGRLRVIKVPRFLELPLQRRISKTVKVEPRFSGTLPEGYIRAGVSCVPAEIVVSGPERAIRALTKVYTDEIPLNDATAGFNYETRPRLTQPMTAAQERINVQVDIARNFIRRVVSDLPVMIIGQPQSGLKPEFASPLRVSVTVSGLETRISSLRSSDLMPFVNFSHIRQPGLCSLPVECHVKVRGVMVKAVTPGEIKVKLTKVSVK